MRTVVCCDVCGTPFRLDESLVVARAEVIAFADAHGEHEKWALAIRSDATCTCPRAPAGVSRRLA